MQQNYAQGVEKEENIVEENHFFTEDGQPNFVIKDEEYIKKTNLPKDEDYMLANDNDLEV